MISYIPWALKQTKITEKKIVRTIQIFRWGRRLNVDSLEIKFHSEFSLGTGARKPLNIIRNFEMEGKKESLPHSQRSFPLTSHNAVLALGASRSAVYHRQHFLSLCTIQSSVWTASCLGCRFVGFLFFSWTIYTLSCMVGFWKLPEISMYSRFTFACVIPYCLSNKEGKGYTGR